MHTHIMCVHAHTCTHTSGLTYMCVQSGVVAVGDTLISVNNNNVFGQALSSLRNVIPGMYVMCVCINVCKYVQMYTC